MDAMEYLKTLQRTRREVEAFIDPECRADPIANNHGWTYSGQLGWVLKDSVRADGIGGSRTFYTYEADGARKIINAAESPCRIHTYGDSFAHCDQVSDGQTWQEYLAAQIREPVANYGVGGYGVYQAYRRMLKVEKDNPAPLVVFNIFQDDHYRNLDAWRSIRFGKKTFCGYTLPHLRVDPDAGECVERPNLCPQPADVFNLTDPDYIAETFLDDPVLKVVLATKARGAQGRMERFWVPVTSGLPQAGSEDERIARLVDGHARAALYATCCIVDWLEEFAAETGKKILIVLSHGLAEIRNALLDKPRWDQAFLDHLRTKSFPVVDLRDAHRRDFGCFSLDVDEYLKRYYIGHYGPAGNYFEAWAVNDALVEMLDPPPLPYR